MNFSHIIKNRWTRTAFVCLIVVTAFIALLPVGIKMLAKDWYQDQGVEKIEIDDIDFNLFSGVLAVESLEVTQDSKIVLSVAFAEINFSWVDLFFKHFHIESISLRNFFLDVDNTSPEGMQVGGITLGGGKQQKPRDPEAEKSTWNFGLTEIILDGFNVKYADQKISPELKINNAHLKNVFSWTPDHHAILAINGEVNQSLVSISAELKPFSKNPHYKTHFKIESLELEKFKELAKPGLVDLSGKLSLDTDVEIKIETGKVIQVDIDGKYQLDSFRMELTDNLITLDQLQITGPVKVNHLSQPAEGEQTAISFAGELGSKDIVITDSSKGIYLLGLGQLSLKKIEVNKLNSIKIDSTTLENIEFARVIGKQNQPIGKPVVAVKSAQLNSLQLSNFKLLEIESVVLNELLTMIIKDKKGELVILSKLKKGEELPTDVSRKKDSLQKEGVTSANDVQSESAKSSEPFKFKIGTITVSDKSLLTYKDENVIPKFESVLELKNMRVGNVDNTNKNSNATVSLSGAFGKYGKIDLKGKVKPFADKKEFDLDLDLKNYDLPPLSSYTSEILGYDLTSGQGDVVIKAGAKKGEITGEAKLKFNNLTVKQTNPEHMKKLNEQLSIPLDLSLSLLRDGNDDIKLSIPVNGDLFKPDVGVGDVINTALGNALKGATTAYLKYAFQPFGTLISIVQLAGKAAGAIQLDPIVFDEGDSALRADAGAYLQKIANLIQERKGIRIKLCGISVAADRNALLQQKIELARKKEGTSINGNQAEKLEVTNDDLFSLAKGRAEAIKDHLVTQFKLDPARLFVCHPEIKKETGAKPSVELLI